MVVVHDLGEPLLVEDTVHVDRLGLAREVEVAIVVVADVLLVGARESGQRAQGRFTFAHVPVRNQFMAIRVGVNRQHNHVAEEPERLSVRSADQLIHGLDELLRAQHLVGMQPAIDPDDGLAFSRQRPRLIVGEAVSQRQPTGNVSIAIDLCEVVGGRDHRHPLDAPFFGAPDIHQLHAIGLAVERLPVLLELRICGQEVVVANRRAELLLGRRHRRRRRLCTRLRDRQDQQQRDDQCSCHVRLSQGSHGCRAPENRSARRSAERCCPARSSR